MVMNDTPHGHGLTVCDWLPCLSTVQCASAMSTKRSTSKSHVTDCDCADCYLHTQNLLGEYP